MITNDTLNPDKSNDYKAEQPWNNLFVFSTNDLLKFDKSIDIKEEQP